MSAILNPQSQDVNMGELTYEKDSDERDAKVKKSWESYSTHYIKFDPSDFVLK